MADVPGSPPPIRRLTIKLTALLALVLSLALSAVVAAEVALWRRFAEGAARSETERFADTIRQSTRYSMLHAQADAMREIINAVGSQQDVSWVRILNKEGRVIYSTQPAEIGRVLDKNAEACVSCHRSGEPLKRLPQAERSRIVRTNGHRVLATIAPIANATECSTAACHAHESSQRVLGVLDVAVSLAGTDAAISRRQREVLAGGAAAILVIIALVAFFLHFYVGRPVRHLMTATDVVASGDLDHVIAVAGGDELAALGRAFNRMTVSLREASVELRDLNASLEERVLQKTRELSSAQLQVARAERLAAVGRMAAGIAHEINNPLTGVLTFAHLLAKKAPEGSSERADLEVIIRETNRCAKIIRDLLSFSRDTPARRDPCLIETLVERVLSLIEHQALFHDIRVARRIDPDLPLIVADGSQMEQVLLNIVLNAAQAMPAGGDITIAAARRRTAMGPDSPAREAICISISDTGPGIPAEDLGRIFDPFFTTKAPGQGTGLGLSVSLRMVEGHGGTIEVQSEPGHGATFRVILPAAAVEAAA